jgi:hypothetical protein
MTGQISSQEKSRRARKHSGRRRAWIQSSPAPPRVFQVARTSVSVVRMSAPARLKVDAPGAPLTTTGFHWDTTTCCLLSTQIRNQVSGVGHHDTLVTIPVETVARGLREKVRKPPDRVVDSRPRRPIQPSVVEAIRNAQSAGFPGLAYFRITAERGRFAARVNRVGGSSVDDRNASSRDPLSAGIAWSSRITTLAMGFVLPILAGVWADSRLGTKPALTLTGFVLGLAVGIVQLLQIVHDRGRREP